MRGAGIWGDLLLTFAQRSEELRAGSSHRAGILGDIDIPHHIKHFAEGEKRTGIPRIGIAREVVSRLLKDLEKDGKVLLGRGKISLQY
jgi:hypothetical protein